MPVSDIIGEGLLAQADATNRWKDGKRDKRVREYLSAVGLRPDYTRRYPHEFSGGQRQRIGIARALALNPEFIVCDEPVSALDVSIQSQVLNLLLDLREQFDLTYLFIAHNLSVVEYISDRVGVMYLGKMVEQADVAELYAQSASPLHGGPPVGDPRGRSPACARSGSSCPGDIPSPANPPSGCRFHTRCSLREQLGNPERCVTEDPAFREIGNDHQVACHFAEDIGRIGTDVKVAIGLRLAGRGHGRARAGRLDRLRRGLRDRRRRTESPARRSARRRIRIGRPYLQETWPDRIARMGRPRGPEECLVATALAARPGTLEEHL